ncbi:RND family transporter [Acidobacteriota bacterium]
MREKVLKKLAAWHASHPWRMLGIMIIVTIILAVFAGQLKVSTHTSDLLPDGDPKVVQYNKILDEFVTATSLVIVVQGEEERIKAFADELAPKILDLRDSSQNADFQGKIDKHALKIKKLKTSGQQDDEIIQLQSQQEQYKRRIDLKLFQRVDYKAEMAFLRNHLLMLVKAEDLKNTKDIFMNPNFAEFLVNLNNSMEKEYVGQEESISTREKEDGAVMFLDGIQNLVLMLQKLVREGRLTEEEIVDTADRLLLGDPYMLSYDKTALVMIAVPNFTVMERDLILIGTDSVQALVDELLVDYSDVQAGLSGTIAREHDEQIYAAKSMSTSTYVALVVIFILLIISFRMWVAPLFAIVTLIVGVIWAMGVAWLAVGQLNMITSIFAIVLLGLGIDFAIHMITGFTEWRVAGDNIAASLEKTFLKSGKGIITGAITTACAFLTLVISKAPGMRELGLVAGFGLLAILLATLFFLPTLLVLRERRIDGKRDKRGEREKFIQRDISFRFLGRMGEWLSQKYVFTIVAFVLVTLLFGWSASKMTFDYNFMNIEPKGLDSITLMDTVVEKFDLSIEYALVSADSVSESRGNSEEYREFSSVARTDDISIYLPSSEQQRKRSVHIRDVRETVESAAVKMEVLPDELPVIQEEITRLEMNIMEMQDMAYLGGQDKVDNKCKAIVGDPEDAESRNAVRDLQEILKSDNPSAIGSLSNFQQVFGPYFKKTVSQMCSSDPIHLDDLPVTILDRYCNTTRDQFLINVFPAGNIWENKESLYRFLDDLERVSDNATGLPPLFISIIKIFGRDGRNAMLLTLLIVFVLLWLDFQNPRHALMAMIPLAFGLLWMIGLMHLVGMKFNFINVIGLPLILGIGIDDGVHIIHRWRYEGKGQIRTVFASTGKAVFLTSLTTMFAFGSLAFSIFRGFASFGLALFIGVGACFLTSIIVLPAIIGVIEKRRVKKEIEEAT